MAKLSWPWQKAKSLILVNEEMMNIACRETTRNDILFGTEVLSSWQALGCGAPLRLALGRPRQSHPWPGDPLEFSSRPQRPPLFLGFGQVWLLPPQLCLPQLPSGGGDGAAVPTYLGQGFPAVSALPRP